MKGKVLTGLLPGDVLLMRPKGLLSLLTARLAGSTASHVAVVHPSGLIAEVTIVGRSGGLRLHFPHQEAVRDARDHERVGLRLRGYRTLRVLRHRDELVIARVCAELARAEHQVFATVYYSAAQVADAFLRQHPILRRLVLLLGPLVLPRAPALVSATCASFVAGLFERAGAQVVAPNEVAAPRHFEQAISSSFVDLTDTLTVRGERASRRLFAKSTRLATRSWIAVWAMRDSVSLLHFAGSVYRAHEQLRTETARILLLSRWKLSQRASSSTPAGLDYERTLLDAHRRAYKAWQHAFRRYRRAGGSLWHWQIVRCVLAAHWLGILAPRAV